MGRKVANHNNPSTQAQASCNCQKSVRHECPVPGACNQNGVIYKAIVESNDGNIESYVGLAKIFKKRFSTHKRTLRDKNIEGQTSLSNHYWEFISSSTFFNYLFYV